MTSDTSTDDDTLVNTAAARGSFSSLPLDVISTHVLRSDFLPEPGDLGRLRAVSRSMRDAVGATGREIKKLSDIQAADLGYLSLLKDRHSRGLLSCNWSLCAAAARNGDLQELKALRADEWSWDALTCAYAAKGGHLEVLKWARENGCPRDTKREPGPYMKLCKAERPKIVAANPKFTFYDVGKALGAKWRAMSDAQKAKYM